MEKFAAYFAGVPDPRAENARHDLLEVIFIALTALLCGAESCSDMADFGAAKMDLLKQILKLEHGVPSHDTFSRVFRLIAPEPFEAAFSGFATAFAGPLQGVVAIDGKALRGAYERGCKASPLHLVNVWAVEARAAVAQHLAPGRNEWPALWRRWPCWIFPPASSPPTPCTAAPTWPPPSAAKAATTSWR